MCGFQPSQRRASPCSCRRSLSSQVRTRATLIRTPLPSLFQFSPAFAPSSASSFVRALLLLLAGPSFTGRSFLHQQDAPIILAPRQERPEMHLQARDACARMPRRTACFISVMTECEISPLFMLPPFRILTPPSEALPTIDQPLRGRKRLVSSAINGPDGTDGETLRFTGNAQPTRASIMR